MSYSTLELGQPITAVFISLPAEDRLVSVLYNGTLTASVANVVWVTGNIYQVTFTPISTGKYDIVIDDKIVASSEVVTKNTLTYLRNVEDALLGSWEWDKTNKVLTLLRQDGEEIARYSSDDGPELAFSTLIL